jgi:Leu/Phe-tRNA-protein transferase
MTLKPLIISRSINHQLITQANLSQKKRMQRSIRRNNWTIRGTNMYTVIILVSKETRILQKEEKNSNQTFCKKEENWLG